MSGTTSSNSPEAARRAPRMTLQLEMRAINFMVTAAVCGETMPQRLKAICKIANFCIVDSYRPAGQPPANAITTSVRTRFTDAFANRLTMVNNATRIMDTLMKDDDLTDWVKYCTVIGICRLFFELCGVVPPAEPLQIGTDCDEIVALQMREIMRYIFNREAAPRAPTSAHDEGTALAAELGLPHPHRVAEELLRRQSAQNLHDFLAELGMTGSMVRGPDGTTVVVCTGKGKGTGKGAEPEAAPRAPPPAKGAGKGAESEAAPRAPQHDDQMLKRVKLFYDMQDQYNEVNDTRDRMQMAAALTVIMSTCSKVFALREAAPRAPDDLDKGLQYIVANARASVVDDMLDIISGVDLASETDFKATSLIGRMVKTFDAWWTRVGAILNADEAAPRAPGDATEAAHRAPGFVKITIMQLGLNLQAISRLWHKTIGVDPNVTDDEMAATRVIDFFFLADHPTVPPEAAPRAPEGTDKGKGKGKATTTTTMAPQGAPDQCCICMDDIAANSVMTKLPCDHVFHADCIMSWFRSGRSSCPVCRHDDEAAHRAPNNDDGNDGIDTDGLNEFVQDVFGQGATITQLDQCPTQ